MSSIKLLPYLQHLEFEIGKHFILEHNVSHLKNDWRIISDNL